MTDSPVPITLSIAEIDFLRATTGWVMDPRDPESWYEKRFEYFDDQLGPDQREHPLDTDARVMRLLNSPDYVIAWFPSYLEALITAKVHRGSGYEAHILADQMYPDFKFPFVVVTTYQPPELIEEH